MTVSQCFYGISCFLTCSCSLAHSYTISHSFRQGRSWMSQNPRFADFPSSKRLSSPPELVTSAAGPSYSKALGNVVQPGYGSGSPERPPLVFGISYQAVEVWSPFAAVLLHCIVIRDDVHFFASKISAVRGGVWEVVAWQSKVCSHYLYFVHTIC